MVLSCLEGLQSFPNASVTSVVHLQLVSPPVSRTVVPRGSVSAHICDFVGSRTMVSFRQCIPDY